MNTVKFLVNTSYKGARKKGEILENVSSEIAARWSQNKIAIILEKEIDNESDEKQRVKEGQENTGSEENENIEDLEVKELKELAKSQGIRGYSKMNKEELLEVLAVKEEVSQQEGE